MNSSLLLFLSISVNVDNGKLTIWKYEPAAQLERVKRLLHGAVHFEAFYLQVQQEKRQPVERKTETQIKWSVGW